MLNPIELIVIGGSAGALGPLLSLIPPLAQYVACPIVIALHLHPGQPSMLSTILSAACARAVVEAEDKAPLVERGIYVAAPNYHLLVERDRSLSLSIDPLVHHSRPAIDVLFETAADVYGGSLLGVLLSGASVDGAEGLARIHSAGGIAVVQAPESADSATMPEAGIRRVGPAALVAWPAALADLIIASCLKAARPKEYS